MHIYTRLITDLHKSLIDAGIESEKAAEAAIRSTVNLAHEIGGKMVYLPKRYTVRTRSARDALIRREFNGRNLEEICRKYYVSSATVYRACR